MLILTRRIHEKILIGDADDAIEVVLLAIRGRQARIGINAPKATPIYREEVWERIEQSKT